MNKRMMKAVNLGLALAAIFAAAPARAEICIDMAVDAYAPGSNSRAAELRAQQLERLSAAAEMLETSADATGSEVLLAGLYSGSVAAENAAPVRLEAVRAAMPVRNEARSFAKTRGAIEEIGVDEPAAGAAGEVKPEAADGASAGPAEAAEAASGDGDDDEKATFGSSLLAAAIVIVIALWLFPLLPIFPAAALL